MANVGLQRWANNVSFVGPSLGQRMHADWEATYAKYDKVDWFCQIWNEKESGTKTLQINRSQE